MTDNLPAIKQRLESAMRAGHDSPVTRDMFWLTQEVDRLRVLCVGSVVGGIKTGIEIAEDKDERHN